MSANRRPAFPPLHPVRYAPALDPIGAGEAKIAAEIAEAMLSVARTTFANSGHAIRSVHAKSHGLLKAELEVPTGLPPQLAQGVFARPGRYPAVVRFSTIPGDLLPDSVSTPRGVAIKLLGVEGNRLEGSENATTQDFILVNAPTFPTKSTKAFLSNLKLIAATTDKMEAAKIALSATARAVDTVAKAFGGSASPLRALGGEPPNNILGETFWSQLPLRFGDHIAKLQLVPFSPNLLALTGQPLDLGDGPNVIRQAMLDFFQTNTATWELRAQLATDLDDTSIADPTVEWKEDITPFATVARITARAQLSWSKPRSTAIDDGMGFSPWHGIEAHRPLGQMMRIRKLAYAASQKFRTERNPTPVREPQSLDEIPD